MSGNFEPRDGERMLFCRHADVSEDHVDISKKACPSQPFHWYFVGEVEVKRNDGEVLSVRLLAICNDCNRRAKGDPKRVMNFAAQDAPWIGSPPEIVRFA